MTMTFVFIFFYLLPALLFSVGDKRVLIAVLKFVLGLLIGPVYILMFFVILYVCIACTLKNPTNSDTAWENCITYLKTQFPEFVIDFLIYVEK